MREKEDASDYGYFPEPNLPSICLEQEKVDELVVDGSRSAGHQPVVYRL